jgi:hypothetical protein
VSRQEGDARLGSIAFRGVDYGDQYRCMVLKNKIARVGRDIDSRTVSANVNSGAISLTFIWIQVKIRAIGNLNDVVDAHAYKLFTIVSVMGSRCIIDREHLARLPIENAKAQLLHLNRRRP